jgi:hypothetical protein
MQSYLVGDRMDERHSGEGLDLNDRPSGCKAGEEVRVSASPSSDSTRGPSAIPHSSSGCVPPHHGIHVRQSTVDVSNRETRHATKERLNLTRVDRKHGRPRSCLRAVTGYLGIDELTCLLDVIVPEISTLGRSNPRWCRSIGLSVRLMVLETPWLLAGNAEMCGDVNNPSRLLCCMVHQKR